MAASTVQGGSLRVPPRSRPSLAESPCAPNSQRRGRRAWGMRKPSQELATHARSGSRWRMPTGIWVICAKLDRAHLGFVARPARAVGGEDGDESCVDSMLQSRAIRLRPRRELDPRTASKPNCSDGASDQFAVEALAHQDRAAQLAFEVEQRRQRALVPEAVDSRSRFQ